MNTREKLAKGDFNVMNQELQLDGSEIITLTKRGETKLYKLHVRNLYKKDEEILSDEVIDQN